MPLNKTTPIIILGMHRSGTSCLAGALEEAGLHLGKVSTNNPYNLKGNRENDSVMKLNETILNFNGGSWDKIPNQIIWSNEHENIAIDIIENLKLNNRIPWGFKDPRTTINYAFWKKLLPEMQLIGTFRDPRHVASSLRNRNKKTPLNQCMNLWYEYNTRMLKVYSENPFPIISFDDTSQSYIKKLRWVINETGLFHRQDMSFFDDGLRTKNYESIDDTLPNKIEECYGQLKQASANSIKSE